MKKTKPCAYQLISKPDLHQEIHRLADAMLAGNLSERGNTDQFTGNDAELILQVNRMLDALVSPLRLAAGAIDEIAHGRIPPFVIDEYQGEYNELKRNLNTLLATLFGLDRETRNLIGNISDGRLRTRGNDWDFNGIWRDLIAGVNRTLDAVTDPVQEASDVLSNLAAYDLSARMQGKYHGDHATIKKAINTTAEALHSAIAQVTETVDSVSKIGNRIADSSQVVAKGASEQERQLTETSSSLESIAETSQRSAESTRASKLTAQSSADAINTAKEFMDRMIEAMGKIKSAADNTAMIISEIDTIAKETDTLSTNATNKASLVRSSANGFSVVASEIRRLSVRCEETYKKLEQFQRLVQFVPKDVNGTDVEQHHADYLDLIHDLKNVATHSELLGVNAAISAAHVEGAGNDFQLLTDEIRQLAKRSSEASKKTETLIQTSVDQSRQGEMLSQEIDGYLAGAVEGARTIGQLTEEIASASQDQASGLEQISRTVLHLNEVTHRNANSAVESSDAARNLDQQVKKLAKMVSKFKLDSPGQGFPSFD